MLNVVVFDQTVVQKKWTFALQTLLQQYNYGNKEIKSYSKRNAYRPKLVSSFVPFSGGAAIRSTKIVILTSSRGYPYVEFHGFHRT